ncbi:response regulator transcription factor [Brevibacillus dissolubilis]|uniref:response regulator transcription factor n=1 Tax=Brevibacillus dissolubilis TaxID=1844116 RepID=UPI001116B785|nr:response regulator transcription factor [Brevibacillus dissolubilis]
MSHTILIADDEQEIVELLKLYVDKEGFSVVEAYDGQDAYEKLQQNQIDLAVIDVMMPRMDGFQLLKTLRRDYNIPVIILSARGQDNDKILGLGLGADDYISKPFNPLEVVARIQAQLRRFYQLNATQQPDVPPDTISVGELTLDKSSCVLYRQGEEVPLTSIEYKIIALLMNQPGRVFTKKQIFENVWEDLFVGDDNTIMVHMSKIRDKIEPDPKKPVYLKTVRGLGYKFEKQVLSDET